MTEGNTENLAGMLKKIILEMEEKGISASENIPPEFFRYVEDLDDDCTLSPTDNYKKAYEQKRPDRCIKALQRIYYSKGNFKRTFLKAGCLKNPLGLSYTNDDYELTQTVLLNALRIAKEDAYDEYFQEVLSEFLLYTEAFHKNNIANSALLRNNEFDSYPLAEQILIMCIFIQDQTRMLHDIVASQNSQPHIFTGMESSVATEPIDSYPDHYTSLVSNYEALVEYLNNIIRLSFYTKKEDLKADKCIVSDNMHPFQIPSFQSIVNISMQRMQYLEMEEKFRYSNWNIQSALLLDETPAVLFLPPDDNIYLAHLVAGIRRRYKITSNLLLYAKEIESGTEAIAELSKTFNIAHLNDWIIDEKLYAIAKQKAYPLIEIALEEMLPFIQDAKINEDEIVEILSGYEFLLILAEVYISKVYSDFNTKDYSKYQMLTPIMDFDFLADHYAKLYSCKIEKARKILGYYVFDNKISINDGDIFTRPLIRISKSQVIFCQSLIEQMNVPRNIEKLIQMYGVDIAKSGTLFEKHVRKEMKRCPFVAVNHEAISFQAYDGKDVEFDFFATFDGHLLIFEMKALKTPYDDVELDACRKVVKEGVDQVARRRLIATEDWDKIKQIASIYLPDEPFSPEKVISAVCTNIFDFTGTQINGTPIIDYSLFLKYFIDPKVDNIIFDGKSGHFIKRELLWGNGKPDAHEFEQYLLNPPLYSKISDCYTKSQICIPVSPDGYPTAYDYYVLTKDPFSLPDTDRYSLT